MSQCYMFHYSCKETSGYVFYSFLPKGFNFSSTPKKIWQSKETEFLSAKPREENSPLQFIESFLSGTLFIRGVCLMRSEETTIMQINSNE